MAGDPHPFDAAIDEHDRLLSVLGLDIWVGSEPTFTDPSSLDPEWTRAALGDDKRERAERLVRRLAAARPGTALLRSVGRQYPDETVPRWSYGVLANRDGRPVWGGPPDPLLVAGADPCSRLAPFADALVAEAAAQGFFPLALPASGGDELRVLLQEDEAGLRPDRAAEAMHRRSVHEAPTPQEGLRDALAEAGCFLFLLTRTAEGVARIELPALHDPGRLRRVLEAVGRAASQAGLGALVLAGHPPPADASFEWTTVTPDPAVVEINTAPYPRVAPLLAHARELFAATSRLGLAPWRLWYNGDVDDSGGGGHITLGGPSPEKSPFMRHPELLPGLVRYANHHPGLSYLFAHDHIGAGGQSVRADERDREHFEALALSLELLAARPDAGPDLVWRSLAPFLADVAGNSHRAELNIEKFCNPFLPDRGRLGVVEFRALRMAASPEWLAALAALFRSVAARLVVRPFEEPLMEWGGELHDRFALPFWLGCDLRAVLADLARAGVPLSPAIEEVLFDDEFRLLGRVLAEGVTLELRRALEFPLLVGDVSSEERGPSRPVDASAARLELCLRPAAGADPAEFSQWQVNAEGLRLPLRDAADEQGPARLFGLRYRRFFPAGAGLHPLLPATGPIALVLWHPGRAEALRVSFHEWRPDGEAYDGLPATLAEATARRQARVVAEIAPRPEPAPNAPRTAMTAWFMDLRRVAAKQRGSRT